MTIQILKEDLRVAQENIWSKAFDADKRYQPKTALAQLITCELMNVTVGTLMKLNKKLK